MPRPAHPGRKLHCFRTGWEYSSEPYAPKKVITKHVRHPFLIINHPLHPYQPRRRRTHHGHEQIQSPRRAVFAWRWQQSPLQSRQ
jgi:hypothetical protein